MIKQESPNHWSILYETRPLSLQRFMSRKEAEAAPPVEKTGTVFEALGSPSLYLVAPGTVRDAWGTSETYSKFGEAKIQVSANDSKAPALIIFARGVPFEAKSNNAKTKAPDLVVASMARVFHIRYENGRERHFVVPTEVVVKDLELKNTLPFIPSAIALKYMPVDYATTPQMARIIQWLERHEAIYSVPTCQYLAENAERFTAFDGLHKRVLL